MEERDNKILDDLSAAAGWVLINVAKIFKL